MAGLVQNSAKNSVWLDRSKTCWLTTLTILLIAPRAVRYTCDSDVGCARQALLVIFFVLVQLKNPDLHFVFLQNNTVHFDFRVIIVKYSYEVVLNVDYIPCAVFKIRVHKFTV